MSKGNAALPVSPLAPEGFPKLPAVAGLRAAIGRLGLYKHARNDLILVDAGAKASVGGVFTQSATRSADVDWCRKALAVSGGRARYLVCNAGNSNAFTGAAGVAKNAATTAEVARLAGVPETAVMLAATGVIGQPLAARRVADALPDLWDRLDGVDWPALAAAIATTDTYPKGAGAVSAIADTPVRIAGIAKGSGMIAPNMATMLAFVFTDAALSPAVTQMLIARHVDATFNAITVDGDTSTSDTLLLFATGASGAPMIDDIDDPRLAAFESALAGVLKDLALQVVRDGEGAQKLIEIAVQGARDHASARRIAMSIANSPLFKTAVAGGDANWGRVVMAVGKAGEPIAVERLAVRMGGVWTARDGGAIDYDIAKVDAAFAGRELDVLVEVGNGPGHARVWTCDFTHGYISINGDYRS
ncbi:MAG: bifunctional glutamate N-acetyltransferase/amino-acid acetyltransferase ArgJ [Caulobacterales bacterium]|jgi:glutamate N-acetyltransferase/amino-acid N-acetyltransferase